MKILLILSYLLLLSEHQTHCQNSTDDSGDDDSYETIVPRESLSKYIRRGFTEVAEAGRKKQNDEREYYAEIIRKRRSPMTAEQRNRQLIDEKATAERNRQHAEKRATEERNRRIAQEREINELNRQVSIAKTDRDRSYDLYTEASGSGSKRLSDRKKELEEHHRKLAEEKATEERNRKLAEEKLTEERNRNLAEEKEIEERDKKLAEEEAVEERNRLRAQEKAIAEDNRQIAEQAEIIEELKKQLAAHANATTHQENTSSSTTEPNHLVKQNKAKGRNNFMESTNFTLPRNGLIST